MPKHSEAASVSARRILLIDDHRDGLKARKSVLESQGYDVTAFHLPDQALEHFREAAFDLVVTDYRMPGMNGVELIQALRAQRPDIRVILVSGMVDVLGLNEQNTGADAVIAKTNTEVANLVRTANRFLRTAKKPPASSKPRTATTRRKAV